MRHLVLSVFFAAAFVAAVAGVAQADSPGFSLGDAQAVFNAGHAGGSAIRFHSSLVEGAPADFGSRIGPGQNYSGARLCATDWHLINIFLGTGGDSTFTRADAAAQLDPLGFHWTLDGVPVTSMLTPIKPDMAPELFGLERVFFLASGYILAPDQLAVGQHVSRLVVDNLDEPGIPFDFGDVVFYVDPPGSAACA
jgi:hypothetical protein